MFRFQILFIAGLLSGGLLGQHAFISNAHILPMTGEGLLENRDVLIRDGKIQAIARTGTLEIPDGVSVIDADGMFLLPGLSEMHAHIPVAEGGDDSYVRETMLLYLSKGVTVIRGMLGNPYHITFRQQANEGLFPAPRVYTSSPSMNGNSIPSSEKAIQAVTEAVNAGYDFLKIHPGVPMEAMQSLVRTSNELGITYAGHVPADVGIRNALRFGFSTIDHADGFIEGLVKDGVDPYAQGGFFGFNVAENLDWDKMEELADMTVEHGVWLVPTQSLFTRWISPEPAEKMMAAEEMKYLPSATRYAWTNSKARMLSEPSYSREKYEQFIQARNRILLALYEKGVPFLLGSDSPQVMNVPGFSIHHEIASLIDAGIPKDAILESGTVNVARFFGEEGKYGVVAVGADADLILVENNPMDDIATLKNPVGTFRKGNWMDRSFFAKALAAMAEKYRGE